ncbi:MAG: rubrerythrin family protein [Limnochordia bacterium]|jgi:rubrerythrin|nr:rubrerythrin family protein [Limnochordia bacterium]MDI9464206.1 rubrerythrin family protein [Bacillota bacterium]NLO95280.1 rubrerythrin family protein [Bacillota bacterium]HAI52947.1 rubrerythrin [Bacillota bacterium]HAN95605.1 rubrerythrin [Bacillota bacterium]
MRIMTEKNLRDAFAGESMAHMKYQIYANVAEKEGLPNVAKLFRAIAYAELVHARNHLKELGGIKDSVANLQDAIDGETYEVEEMYPAFKVVAELQQEKGAVRSTHYALEAEKIHADMYGQAKKTVQEKKIDIELGTVYVCDVCGWTHEGDAPEKCPICQAPKSQIRAF